MADERAREQIRIVRRRDYVVVDGERIGYAFHSCDARTATERAADLTRHAPGGALILLLPGHGQTAFSLTLLLTESALCSHAGVAWLADIDPPAGGDPVRARALPAIIRRHWAELRAGETPPPGGVVLAGWSHGGGEALRAAAGAPDLVAAAVGLCATGLIERKPGELIASFAGEVARILLTALRQGPAALWQAVRVGLDIAGGMAGDLVRTRSLRRVVDDARWAAQKVTGPDFGYGGRVALVFAEDDTVIRWQAVLPGCTTPAEIPGCLADYQRTDFPCAGSLAVRVLSGNHLSPGVDPDYARTALELTGQLCAEEERPPDDASPPPPSPERANLRFAQARQSSGEGVRSYIHRPRCRLG